MSQHIHPKLLCATAALLRNLEHWKARYNHRSGLVITTIVLLVFSQRSTLISQAPELTPNESEHRHHTFTDAGSGRTGGYGARQISFHNYKAEDGVFVNRMLESYDSESSADTRLEKLLSHASKVIDDGTKHARDRQVNARRIVVMAKVPDGRLLGIVAWKDGSKVWEIRSVSLSHALDFEEQIYPSKLPSQP